jgi:phage recombination protein Bet
MGTEVTISPLQNSLVPDADGNIFGFKAEVVELFWLTNAAEATTPAERVYFLSVCQSMQLDPRRGHIFFTKRWDSKKNCHRPAIITAVNGLRAIAERSGEYIGCVKKEWCGPDGVWKDVWLNEEMPAAARAWVARRGHDRLIPGVCLMKHFFDDKSPTWKKMPELMLAKCAEAAALRDAYPGECQGIETMEEDAGQVINVTPNELPPADFKRADLRLPETIEVQNSSTPPVQPVAKEPVTRPEAEKKSTPNKGAVTSPPPLTSSGPMVGGCLQNADSRTTNGEKYSTTPPVSPVTPVAPIPPATPVVPVVPVAPTPPVEAKVEKPEGKFPWSRHQFPSQHVWDPSVVFVKNIENHYQFMFDVAAEFGVPFNADTKPFLTEIWKACSKMPMKNLAQFVWEKIYQRNSPGSGLAPAFVSGTIPAAVDVGF